MKLIVGDDASDTTGRVGKNAVVQFDLCGESGIVDGANQQTEITIVGVNATGRRWLWRRNANGREVVSQADNDHGEKSEDVGELHFRGAASWSDSARG